MTIELPTVTVAELHAQLQALIEQGKGELPVCATDCRARYPFQAYTVLNQSGYTDALLIYVRPDAHFAQRDPLPINWGPSRVREWNAEADTIKQRCGAFADGRPSLAASRTIIEGLLEYAVKFAEQEDEPSDGDCWENIEAARKHLDETAVKS